MHLMSFDRADFDGINNLTLREVYASPVRDKIEQDVYQHYLAEHLRMQIDQHGDRRLNHLEQRANAVERMR